MRTIAYRRHHRERMVARAKEILKSWGDKAWAEEAAVRWADNMKKCSCDMCGNARKHYGTTIQEDRFIKGEEACRRSCM